MTTTTVSAPDIVCQGCANAIKKAVGALGGVAEVAVDVAAKKVTVKHDEASAPRQSVTEAMERAGFSASSTRFNRKTMMTTKTKQAALASSAAAITLGLGAVAAAIQGCTNTVTSDNAPSAPQQVGQAGHGATAGHEGHTMGSTGLEVLKRAAEGREFDIAFLSQMIAHHEAAVEMAEQALKSAKDNKTKTEARKVVAAQTGQITEMTGWLKEWYGVEPSQEQQDLVRKDMQGMMAMPISSDKMFYEMMIPHHQGAVDMSELALTKSSRAAVKKLAGQIARDQKAEIAAYRRALGPGAR